MTEQHYQKFLSTVGSEWPGFAGIDNLMIFGDSYTDVLYDSRSPHPTREEPLGVPFPGRTFTETGNLMNWVGYLVENRIAADQPVLVYDYAVGGHRVVDVAGQIHDQFMPIVGQKPDWAPWKSGNTLFITWIGINDCGYNHRHERDLNALFELQEELYQCGARNFMLVDVPPINRSPAYAAQGVRPSEAQGTYVDWNKHLHARARSFHEKHPDASIFMFSSWETFTRVLDDPVTYGFSTTDVSKSGGQIWMDFLHPTTKMHGIIAEDMWKFLNEIPACGAEAS